MLRRDLFLLGALVLPGFARAHHGWSSFDQDRPIWIEGEAARVAWRNPHAEVKLRVAADLALPADLATRPWPAQSAGIDGRALGAKAVLPTRKDREWEVELAPLSRLDAWKVAEIRPGQRIGVLGYTFLGEKGDAIVRAEYLVVGYKVYGLRSSPV